MRVLRIKGWEWWESMSGRGLGRVKGVVGGRVVGSRSGRGLGWGRSGSRGGGGLGWGLGV